MAILMTASHSAEVLICGAGPAGLILAIELARRGVSFRLIDKMAAPFHGSRGKGIQPRTLEIFEDLGILDRLLAAGGPYPLAREYRPDGSRRERAFMEHVDPTPDEPYPMTWLVPQFATESALRERLLELGHRPTFGCTLVEFAQDAGTVSARLATEHEDELVRVRYLVGADGGSSFVRRALEIAFPGKTLAVRGLVADVVLTGLDRDVWHQLCNDALGRQIALCPLRGTDLFQLQTAVELEGDIDLSIEGLSARLAQLTGRSGIRIRSVPWASAFHMNARLADRYRAGRTFLIGDAAHTHPPTGGQGLNTSIQDAYNLGWKLSAVIAGAPESLLDSYEEERRPIAASMLGLTTGLLDAALERHEKRRGREIRQLDLGYPDSVLSLGAPQRTSGPAAGDRAPDAPIRAAGGAASRLFELFKGTHWTLLGYEAERRAVIPRPGLRIHVLGAAGELIDEQGHFRDAYALTPGTWVLVRPDGYIGAIVPPEGLAALESYLEKSGLGISP
jgi:2-polyprenyl-6-methoxyphenol hydroxylase-like FAD-dependent oxidoreductase